MFTIEARQKYSSIGLIDDFVVYGYPSDYEELGNFVATAASLGKTVELQLESGFLLSITADEQHKDLFTCLQNENNEYFSSDDWESRNIINVTACAEVLNQLAKYLCNVGGRGDGYSYISEYSNQYGYSVHSPEWRLHVQST